MQSPGFQQFYKANREWLQPYGVFKFLQDLFGTAEHWHWGSLSRPNQRVSPSTRCLTQMLPNSA